VGEWQGTTAAYRVVVSGNHAYASCEDGGLKILKILNPASPSLSGTYTTTNDIISTFVTGNNAYVAATRSGLYILNISTPSSPTYLSKYKYGDFLESAEDVVVSNNKAYVAHWEAGLHILDVSNPASPTFLGKCNTQYCATRVVVSGNYAYVLIKGTGIQVVNISSSSSPTIASTFEGVEYPNDIVVSGDYAYVADTDTGFVILDVENPANLHILSSFDLSQPADGIALYKNYAFVSNRTNGVRVIDVTSVITPKSSGSYSSGNTVMDVEVAGNYAFTAETSGKVQILRLSGTDIPDLNITSPNGGENWNKGSTHNITWTSSNMTGNVTIDLYKGSSFCSNLGTASASAGSFSWTIASGLSSATNYTLRIYQGNIVDYSNSNFSISANPAVIALDPTGLNFGAAGSTVTPSQTVLIKNSGGGTLNWTALPNQSWLTVSPLSGSGNDSINVGINSTGLTPGTYSGTISFSDPSAGNSPQAVSVHLEVKSSTNDSAPFGTFETPTSGSTVFGSIPVTGWVLDDIATQKVSLYREQDASHPDVLVFIGDAVFVEGARPDVETAYPTYPNNYKAGWGYMLLTNFLPSGGNGTFVLHAKAQDYAGNLTSLGTKTIICNNAAAVKPFGAIDTPPQGGSASGTGYVNFGWALTPLPNTIPTNGSTISVYIDGISVGHPVYNQYRADIATLFPGYNNTNGAIGYFYFNTTSYDDGVHTIAWLVSDNGGNTDGIGSRFFTIQNSSGSTSTGNPGSRYLILNENLLNEPDIPLDFYNPIAYRTGYKHHTPSRELYPDEYGIYHITFKELDRLIIDISNETADKEYFSPDSLPTRRTPDQRFQHSSSTYYYGYSKVGNQRRPLPIGSTFDRKSGVFYWQAGPGFIGEYQLVFIENKPKGEKTRKIFHVTIVPRT